MDLLNIYDMMISGDLVEVSSPSTSSKLDIVDLRLDKIPQVREQETPKLLETLDQFENPVLQKAVEKIVQNSIGFNPVNMTTQKTETEVLSKNEPLVVGKSEPLLVNNKETSNLITNIPTNIEPSILPVEIKQSGEPSNTVVNNINNNKDISDNRVNENNFYFQMKVNESSGDGVKLFEKIDRQFFREETSIVSNLKELSSALISSLNKTDITNTSSLNFSNPSQIIEKEIISNLTNTSNQFTTGVGISMGTNENLGINQVIDKTISDPIRSVQSNILKTDFSERVNSLLRSENNLTENINILEKSENNFSESVSSLSRYLSIIDETKENDFRKKLDQNDIPISLENINKVVNNISKSEITNFPNVLENITKNSINLDQNLGNILNDTSFGPEISSIQNLSSINTVKNISSMLGVGNPVDMMKKPIPVNMLSSLSGLSIENIKSPQANLENSRALQSFLPEMNRTPSSIAEAAKLNNSPDRMNPNLVSREVDLPNLNTMSAGEIQTTLLEKPEVAMLQTNIPTQVPQLIRETPTYPITEPSKTMNEQTVSSIQPSISTSETQILSPPATTTPSSTENKSEDSNMSTQMLGGLLSQIATLTSVVREISTKLSYLDEDTNLSFK